MSRVRESLRVAAFAAGLFICSAPGAAGQIHGLQSSDLSRLQFVSDVHVSPDGARIAYTITKNDRPGRPYSQVWIMDVATGRSIRLGSDKEGASNPRWSPDGRQIAYIGRDETGGVLMVSRSDGSSAVRLAPVYDTNSPLPSAGERLSWSPDGTRLAFVSATPQTDQHTADPIVITRYLYKPTASEGLTRFNDNRRVHIFVVDVAAKTVRQLTDGDKKTLGEKKPGENK